MVERRSEGKNAKGQPKVPKRRSATAAALQDPRYRARVDDSAKVYSRKGKAAQKEEDEL